MMKVVWVAVAAAVVVMVVGAYISTISGLNELGPVLVQFSSAFGKVIGGITLMVSGVALVGTVVHYYFLTRKREV
jgi:type II secretory pathway component PulF